MSYSGDTFEPFKVKAHARSFSPQGPPRYPPRQVLATVNGPLLYVAVTYAYFHKWLSISRRAHTGQASVGQRPLLSQERSSCEGQVGRAGSVGRPEQINLFEGCLGSPTGPSSEKKRRPENVTDGGFSMAMSPVTFTKDLPALWTFDPRKSLVHEPLFLCENVTQTAVSKESAWGWIQVYITLPGIS